MLETNSIQKPITNLCHTDSPVMIKNSASKPYSQILQESLSLEVSKLENKIQRKLRQLLFNQKQQLSEVGEKINSLTQELEKIILEFHTITKITNKTYRSLQYLVEQTNKTRECNNELIVVEDFKIVVINYSRLPIVEEYDSGYILKERKVNLSNLD